MSNEENAISIFVSEAADHSSEMTIGYTGRGEYEEPKWAERVKPVSEDKRITSVDLDNIINSELRYQFLDEMEERFNLKTADFCKDVPQLEFEKVLDAMSNFANAVKLDATLEAMAMLSDSRYVNVADVQSDLAVVAGRPGRASREERACSEYLSQFFDRVFTRDGIKGDKVKQLVDYIMREPIERHLNAVNANLAAFKKKVEELKEPPSVVL